MRIIGIDAAFAVTGYAVIESDRVLDWGIIKTFPHETDLARVTILRERLTGLLSCHALYHPSQTVVAIERADWTHGAGDDRSGWVREARARGALGLGFATAVCVALQFGITPTVLGVREWMRALDCRDKDGVAAVVALAFHEDLEVDYGGKVKLVRRSGRAALPKGTPVVRDRRTDKRLPDHATDALGLAWVAGQRLFADAMIEMAKEGA